MMSARGGRRVALVALYPLRDEAMPPFPISNHGMRMVEASLRAAGIAGLELRVWDLLSAPADALAHELLSYAPDVIGFSAYLWSFPTFVEAARIIKTHRPEILIVFGGPSARPSMLSLPPFQSARKWIDVLVINEGELAFQEIVAAQDRSPAVLNGIAGLALPAADGWRETPSRPLGDLNELASPYVLGLVPRGGLGVLQTYRGCPFTCSFCEWGVLESPRRVRDVDSLEAELKGMAAHDTMGALLVDAGLNLNPHAFTNLRRAADATGFLHQRQFICEVYPAKVKQEHLEFLADIGRPLVGVGLQSFDNEVLAHVERSYDERRFDEILHRLTEVAGVAIEIILGLPGDNPKNFRASFERARKLPCALRVYHCVVLPSGLMVRAPANYQMVFDPISLKMRSCLGWSEADLRAECEFLTERTHAEGGFRGEYFWVFSPPR